MKGLLIALLAAISLLALHQATAPSYAEFQQWKLSFEHEFKSEGEEFYRRTIFYRNLVSIQEHNSNPTHTYKMGVNQFTVYTQEEFSQRFLFNIQIPANIIQAKEDGVSAVIVDWVEQGAVNPVKNQGTCGGAVLYATLGGLEGLSKVATGTLQTFSDQQLIDCVFGCTGAQPLDGFNYYKTHSVCTEKEYPRTGREGKCQSKSCDFRISGYKIVNSCTDLVSGIMKQPVSVAVDATKWSVYASGVFSNCGTAINHMVLLVGLADQYWKCKNSWGTTWGEKGYIRLARGDTCGICQYAVFPQH